jgi:prepilin-type N-terminal cleavage/methylation domain-containing protein
VKRRDGFTLIELLTVVFLIGILATLALFKYRDLRNSALVAQMIEEMRAVQIAVLNYHAEKEEWPAETGPGAVPAGLGALLPGQLAASLDRGDYMLDYDNFGSAPGEVVIGVTVTSTDPKLFAKFVRTVGTRSPFFVSGSGLTYLISGPGGVF